MITLLLGLALAAPAPQADLARVKLRSSPATVKKALEKQSATVTEHRWRQPGAMAEGLLERPGLLAQLNRHRVKHPFLASLPKAGPLFLVAEKDGARAVYAFHKKALWAVALYLPPSSFAPDPDPFLKERNAPLTQTVKRMCPKTRTAGKDDYGNPMAFKGSCRGGTFHADYDPTRSDAALQILVHR